MPSTTQRTSFQPSFESQVNFLTDLTRYTSNSVRKLSELHMQYAQHVLQDSINATRALLSCSDPFQVLASSAQSAQPVLEHWRNYQQQLMGILGNVQVDLTRSAESVMPEGSRYMQAMVQSLARPNGAAGATSATFVSG